MNKIKFTLFFFLSIVSFIKVNASTILTSDTINILHYDIHLTITDTVDKTISGYAHLHFKSKMDGISNINLDFLKLDIDSIIQNGVVLSYTYDSLLLKVTLNGTLNTNDSADITIYYHGKPQKDPELGGFNFNGQYVFNVGAGFSSVPHSFGRCWHPCFDNFVERATYDNYFTIDTGKTASSNGLLMSDTVIGNGTHTLHWRIIETIPSYLACVGVARFVILKNTFYVGTTPIPVELYVLPGDSAKLKKSFVNLESIFNIFNKLYGPYRWEKVGYEEVPCYTSSIIGSMEHASMIAYPSILVDGTLNWEGPVEAHELSHHWWGDLVTIQTEQDMWMHEGWAEYSYRLFFENFYGESTFMNSYQSNHLNAVQEAHVIDGYNYFPVSGVPDSYTYGRTTYWKGADVAQSLRGYLGDTLFFRSIKTYLNSMAFKSTNSYIFRDSLSKYSGVDLTDFFNDWVFSPGWASFTIDSFDVRPNGSTYFVDVFMRQKLNHAPHYYNNVPLELTLMDSTMDTVIRKVSMSGYCAEFTVESSFPPAYVGVNLRNRISESVTADDAVIKKKGNLSFTYGKLDNLNVDSIGDSVFLRSEHVFSPPDPINPPIPNLHISDYRYWKIDGIIPKGFDASAFFDYNGTANTGVGNLDNDLLAGGSEDSLVILYRPSAFHSWTVLKDSDVTNYFGGSLVGSIEVKHLKKGEYAFAIHNPNKVDSIEPTLADCYLTYSVHAVQRSNNELMVLPTITTDETVIEGTALNNCQVRIFNINGETIWNENINQGDFNKTVSTSEWAGGIYFVSLISGNGEVIVKKLIVTK